MIQTVKRLGRKEDQLIIHGGEVLSLPLDDFEAFLKCCFELQGRTHIQSSLFGLKKEHIELFKKYKTNIGISIDGPPELNILRGPRNPEHNLQYQVKLVQNIALLEQNGIERGYLAILTKVNASSARIDQFVDWFVNGPKNCRCNPMFLPTWAKDTQLARYQLSPQELKVAWLKLAEAMVHNPGVNFIPGREFVDNLLGTFHLSPCIVSRCDYLTTTCRTILPDGKIARCDRCFQEGYYYAAEMETLARSEMLGQTECKGCRYWEICGGGCPGEGTDNDFRKKTYYCEAYYSLYEYLETYLRGLIPNFTFSIDIPNWFSEFKKGKRHNPVEKWDQGTWRTPGPRPAQGCTLPPGSHIDHYDSSGQYQKSLQPPEKNHQVSDQIYSPASYDAVLPKYGHWEIKKQLKDLMKFKSEIEYLTVKEGLRKINIFHLYPEAYDLQIEQISRDRLVFLPLFRTKRYSGFSHCHSMAKTLDQSSMIFGVIAQDLETASEFVELYKKPTENHQAIGDMLGYPSCCSDWFMEIMSKAIDPVYEIALASDHTQLSEFEILIEGADPKLYSHLRYFGGGIIPWFPCSLECKVSKIEAQKWFEFMKNHNYNLASKMIELLKPDSLWDLYNAQVIVDHPLFKGYVISYYSKNKKIVRFENARSI
jgi:radical SAM protein with 4Fe4S-binding SPASM domain